VGEMKFPLLSFLLSNIEILTQFFRPITLSARLWVNIWVGHLIIRAISLIFFSSFRRSFIILTTILQAGFFLFEAGIISLQTFVFSYLVKVYFEENFLHSNLSY
jgi:F0F1-type ATP synthase membrane subunit a